jgi:hypothetical protein
MTGIERAPLRLGSISIAADGITESTREGHRTVFVPRAGIERVAIRRGFTCERPIASLVGAVVFLGGAAVALGWMMQALRDDYVALRVRLFMVVVIPAVVGAMFLWTLVRRGRYLRVDTTQGPRKLLLRGAVDRDAMREFLSGARSRFDYEVDLSSDEV